MKIRKAPKRVAPPLPEVAALIARLLSSSDEELPSVLATAPEWLWPRGDLYSWTKVLNRFDAVLEGLIDDYEIKRLQVKEFTPHAKQTILEILKFERLLLDHCTNRKLFASYDRLGDLLFTQDLDILEHSLRLLHRPAQQYSSPSHSSELSSNTFIIKRLLSLSQGWGPTREAGFSLAKLATADDDAPEFPPELSEVHFQFYRRQVPPAGDRQAANVDPLPTPALDRFDASQSGQATPTPASAAASSALSASAPPPVFGLPASSAAASSSTSTATLEPVSTPVKGKSKLTNELKEVFKTPVSGSSAAAAAGMTTTTSASGASSSTHEGLTTLSLKLSVGKTPMAVLAEVVEEHDVPEEERFELLNRIRLASGLTKKETRRQLLVVRCLAIATYAHLVPEATAQTDLFLYEPDLVAHIAELIHPELAIPYNIQTAAVSALDAISRYRHRIAEVISAINASANHGVLLSLFRSMVAKLAVDAPEPPFEFVEAVLTFLTYLITTATYSNMLVAAGVIPLLVQIVQNELPSRLPVVVKAINLLDHIVYSNPNGFTIFCNAGGLEALTDRAQSAVDHGIETHGPGARMEGVDAEGSSSTTMTPSHDPDNAYGVLPFPRFSALKAILRSLNRMMQSAGTADGLRNLIDSSLPKTVKKVIEHRKIFGPMLLSLALSVMATFVHNEPTSLSVLQENKLPETFYDAVEEDIEAIPEVFFAVPNVLGALCLNQTGLDQLAARPAVIPKMMDILTSERHLKVLQEKEAASQMGAFCDELVRHHPSLKEPVLKAVLAVIHRIAELGSADRNDLDTIYHLLPAGAEVPTGQAGSSSTSVAASMSSSGVEAGASSSSSSAPVLAAESGEAASAAPANTTKAVDLGPAEPAEGYIDNNVVLFIQVTCRFLEGLFHNQSHCKDFIKAGGLTQILNFYTLPCLPYDFAGSAAADALFALVQVSSEADPTAVLTVLLQPVRVSLDATRSFWAEMGTESKLSGLTELPKGPELDEANTTFRRLIALHGRVALLADMYRGVGFSHARIATSFLQLLNLEDSAQLLIDLGKLHRACVWENILIKTAIPAAVVSVNDGQHGGGPSVARGQMQTVAGVPDDVLQDINTGLTDSRSLNLTTDDTVRTRNGKALKYLISQMPASLTPFFQAILKFLFIKRGNDAAHRKEALKTAGTVAQITLDHLRWGMDVAPTLDSMSTYAYGTVMIGFASVLLFDADRPMSGGHLQTMLLSSFERIGGVQAIVDIAARYTAAFDQLNSSEDIPSLDNVHIFSGLKVALYLLQSLVSSKALFESSQTAAITTRDKQVLTDDDDFDPHRFLVKLRSTILPLIRDIWRAGWLTSAPLSVCRSVVQTLLRIMEADNEEKPEPAPAPVGGAAAGGAGGAAGVVAAAVASLERPSPPADRIQQLVDMGFTAHAARTALQRCHNNTSLAAEFLLSHPGAFAQPAPAPAAAADAGADAGADADAAPADMAAVAPAAASSTASGSADAPMDDAAAAASGDDVKMKTPDVEADRWADVRPALNAEREKLREGLSERALALADEHELLVVDIKPAYTSSVPAVRSVVEATSGLVSEALGPASAKVAVRLRLLAVVLQDGLPGTPGDKELVERIMDLVVSLSTVPVPAAAAFEDEGEGERAKSTTALERPKWRVSQFHVADTLLQLSQDIVDIPVVEADPPTPDALPSTLFVGPAFEAAKQIFFDQALALLEDEASTREEIAAALRLLVLLTRDHTRAVEFARRGGVAAVTRPYKSTKRPHSVHAFVAILLRHVVEDPQALLALMQQEIRAWFSAGSRPKNVDVAHFIKNTKQIALRDPELFIRAVEAECTLNLPFGGSTNYIVSLKPALKAPAASSTAMIANDAGDVTPTAATSEMQVDEPTLPSEPQSDILEAMVHYLLNELMSVGRQAIRTPDSTSTLTPSAPAPAPAAAADEDDTAASSVTAATAAPSFEAAAISSPTLAVSAQDGLSDYVYACLLMQNLTELVGSYLSCKTAFLTMGRRRGGKDSLLSFGKPRTAMLSFIINELLCSTSLAEQAPPIKPETKRAINLANCAMSILVALCSDVSAGTDLKDVSPDLVAVRKVVLDAISKAIKDATTSSDHIDLRYGRLHSLADLCHRLLTARASVQTKGHDDGTLHIAKVMLEKNFAVLLTNALAEIDLNYPDVKLVVTDILKPLEHLTKISIKMGRASDKTKEGGAGGANGGPGGELTTDSDMFSGSELDESTDDEGGPSADDEQTPDLYRNSALGMYGGEMEDFDGDSDAEDDEDMDGYDDDDMSDEGPTDSGTESGSSDEEALENELLADGDDWEDEDDEDGEGGGSDDEEIEGEEILFENDEDIIDDDDDDDDGHQLDDDDIDDDDDDEGGIIFEDEEGNEEDEDQRDFENELGTLEADFDIAPPPDNRLTNWGWAPSGDRNAPGSSSARRRLFDLGTGPDDFFDPLGRAAPAMQRSAGRNQGVYIPLESAPGGGPPNFSIPAGGLGGPGGAAATEEILSTIEGLIGGGGAAVRLLEQLVARSRDAGPNDTIRIGIAAPPSAALDGTLLGGFTVNPDGSLGRHPTMPTVLEGRGLGGPGYGSGAGAGGRGTSSTDPAASAMEFIPLPTAQRWLDEERITQGKAAMSRAAKLTNHVINRLLPVVLKAKREQKEKDEALEQEKKKKEAEEEEVKAKEKEKEEAEKKEKEEAEKKEKEESAAAEGTTGASSTEQPAVPESTPTVAAVPPAVSEDIEMSDAQPEPEQPAAAVSTTAEAPSTMDTDEAGLDGLAANLSGLGGQLAATPQASTLDIAAQEAPEAPSNADAAPAPASAEEEPAARVTITIHGEEVDITDTGIDITFLEALPDEMREEVLNQHFRERRPAVRSAASAPTEINTEFLDALPPDIRAEVLQQEAVEQSRRDREEAARAARAAGGAPPAQPADIDPASFLASLDPQLRNVVLMEQEEGFLDSLPGEMLAGLGAFRGEQPPQAGGFRLAGASLSALLGGPGAGSGPRGSRGGGPSSGNHGHQSAKKPATRDAIQLLDKAGIASLVRLLFFPEVSRKTIVPRVLVNLCENSKTRGELLNLLLTVVQDGTGDLSAVDKSFAQMTLRGGKASASTPAKATPRRKGPPETPGPAGLFSHLSAESIPTFIAQRCFDALAQIVSNIDRASFFFLTEHDVLVGLKRAQMKKGKGKEKQIPQTKYPLVVLLGLLDRPALLKNSSMMDSLTALLVTVTRPLTTLAPPPAAEAPKDGLLSVLGAPLPSSASTTTTAGALAAAGPASSAAAGSAGDISSNEAVAAGSSGEVVAVKPAEESLVLSHPPQIPNNVLRLVVNVLTVGECSSTTFKNALTLIHQLSFIPDAKDIITSELRSQAQDFGNTLQADLDELAGTLRLGEEQTRAATIAKFTPASSTQAKLLRVLKTLEHIYSAKALQPSNGAPSAAPAAAAAAPGSSAMESSSSPGAAKPAAPEEQITAVYESFSFSSLWQKLSSVLTIVEESTELDDVATVLLPVVESLMVVCKYSGRRKEATATQQAIARESQSPRSPSAEIEQLTADDVFVKFTTQHKKTLNQLVRNNPALMSGSFALLVENPKILSFDVKRLYFSQTLKKKPNRDVGGTLQVNVRRDFVFVDSFSKFQRWTPEQIKYGKLSCRFWDEEGVDAGGVAREWFSVLAKSIFNPNFALFEPSSSGAATYQFNRLSAVNPDHLAFFRFVGVVLAKAVQDGRLLDAHFVRSVYRQLLGAKNMGLSDLEIVDPSYHTSLKWMVENDIDGVLDDMTFSIESDAFGEQQIHDLIPDGRNIAVTNENKAEYVQLNVNFRLADSIKEQSKAFIEGFYSIIPQSLLKIFDAGELELLISGLPSIDVDELKNSVQLHGYRNSDVEIVWLWRALRSFSQAERASFLQFITGSSRVPLGGFSQLIGSNGVQPVQVHRGHGDADRIPTAHTCYNQLDLGPYSSYEALREKLSIALYEGSEGFAFA